MSPAELPGPNVERTTGLWRILSAEPLPETTPGADKAATIGVTDGLVHLFANRWAPLVAGRNLGLMAMELFIPARDVLAQRTTGLGRALRSIDRAKC